jgi:phosphoadenosine phosphosulfate reductase
MNISFLENLAVNPDLGSALYQLSRHINDKIVFSTSFGIEDQVIAHAIFSQQLKNIAVFTLDTGRLFPETYDVWDKTVLRYKAEIKAYYPNATDLENFIDHNGINAFYNSQELRKECCFLRKVNPLKRALKDAKIWITGVRAEQSESRNELSVIQWDEQYQLYKYNPLLHWSAEDVAKYVKQHGITYNHLHDQGFVSIGCAPCTRAIKAGESFRDGRWWWEDSSKKECGLHK